MINRHGLTVAAAIAAFAACGMAQATVVTYLGSVNSATTSGLTAPGSSYLNNGYELFSVSPVGTTSGNYSQSTTGGSFLNMTNLGATGAETRGVVTSSSLPSYVSGLSDPNYGNTAINEATASGYGYATVDNPASTTGAQIETGVQLSYLPGTALVGTAKIFNINLSPTSTPTTFDVSVLLTASNDQTITLGDGAATASATVASTRDPVLYNFQVAGANAGDILNVIGTSSGTGTFGGAKNSVDAAGVLFSNAVTAVPEPATLGIFGLGAGLLLLSRKRRKLA